MQPLRLNRLDHSAQLQAPRPIKLSRVQHRPSNAQKATGRPFQTVRARLQMLATRAWHSKKKKICHLSGARIGLLLHSPIHRTAQFFSKSRRWIGRTSSYSAAPAAPLRLVLPRLSSARCLIPTRGGLAFLSPGANCDRYQDHLSNAGVFFFLRAPR